jgi:nicotinamide riboside transporter PnuC
MGIALWLGCATVIFFIARSVPYARPRRWIGELVTALISAMAMGVTATALDFGGWNEPDWRAALFVVFGVAAIIGAMRLIRRS